MRKITAGLFITLDGVIEAPQKWNPPYYDDELNQAAMPILTGAGLHLYGRRSYELFRAVFTGPHAPPHAAMMTSTPKAMVSTTLADPGWGPTTVISSNVTTELSKLKQQPGPDIAVCASGTLLRFLLQQDLVDELTLLVHPVLAGTGKHLYEGGAGQIPLTLADARPHSNGIVALHYTRPESMKTETISTRTA
jgi:dihydrofolate reductase